MNLEKREENMTVGVLGAGTWGIALANTFAGNGHTVRVWSAIAEEIVTLKRDYVHPRFPNVKLHREISFCDDPAQACDGARFIILAVPSIFMRDTIRRIAPLLSPQQILISVAKGIEHETLYTMSEVIQNELPPGQEQPIAALSGPTHAEEVILGMPSAIVAASRDKSTAQSVQKAFMSSALRIYTNTDLLGVELCGALKNVIALAVGISNGLGLGDNARAALITRGMAEIQRLGLKMGCQQQTFYGLAGIGDLIVTAGSRHSRNYIAGTYIGQGFSVEETLNKVGMVVEGLNALKPAVALSEKYHVEMPIIRAVDAVIQGVSSPEDELDQLMRREKRSETLKSILERQIETLLLKQGEENTMRRVITYGTFDMLHYGHINLLKRARALGDYLIVVLSTDEFNWNQKQKKCYFTYEQRKALLEAIRYVDLVIPEESWDQKRTDVHEYHIDTFVIGDDWKGKFDFLRDEGVDVVYLPRTPEISTTQIKNDLHSNQ